MVLGETLRGRPENSASKKLNELPSSPEHWKFLATSEFLTRINNLAVEVIKAPDYHDSAGHISNEAWKRLVDGGLLSSSLGERDLNNRQEEIMQAGRILSYHDLSLGLTFGITSALAIMPLQRFGSKEQKEKYLGKIRNGERWGLAVTELNGSGSRALDMDSSYRINDDGTVTLKFAKHLQGLSGKDGLIVVANKAGEAKKTTGFFIVDQENIVTQPTEMAGLLGVSYAINMGEVTLDLEKHLMIELSERGLIDDFQDMFTKSRFLFVAMTLGHQERMEQEANNYAVALKIGPMPQADMPVPQRYLGKIKARRVATEAIFNRVIEYKTNGNSLLNGDTMNLVAEANIVKTLPAEYADRSALDRAELMGGNAYYIGSALQDHIDIWPFLIFEGTRWMLNTQIGHAVSIKPFIRHGHESGKLFDRSRARQNLDKKSLWKFAKIKFATMTKVREEVWGQIVSRLFALGCLDKNKLKAGEFEQAKALLNLEIRQLAEEFLSA